MDCIFCKMAAGEIPVDKLIDDENFFVIRDIAPQAPVHLLVISKVHTPSLAASQGDPALLGALLQGAARAAALTGLSEGFRTVINTGAHGGQTVPHLHVHVLGGKKLTERMT